MQTDRQIRLLKSYRACSNTLQKLVAEVEHVQHQICQLQQETKLWEDAAYMYSDSNSLVCANSEEMHGWLEDAIAAAEQVVVNLKNSITSVSCIQDDLRQQLEEAGMDVSSDDMIDIDLSLIDLSLLEEYKYNKYNKSINSYGIYDVIEK